MQIMGLVAFVGACVGHTALAVFVINWAYGHAAPHLWLKMLRRADFVSVLAAPVVLWWAYGWDLSPLFHLPSEWSGGEVLRVYVPCCCVVGLVCVPIVTLQRLLRRRPAALVSNHTQTVDVSQQLGFRPLGKGKYRLLARMPCNEIYRVDLTERTFCLPRLPAAWDGLTILHLTDLHLHGTPDLPFYRHVMDLCRGWQPDLIALTGDVVDSERHHRWVVPVLGRLKWRIAALAILGNHDLWYDPHLTRRRLARVGFQVLGNSWKAIEVRGEPLVVVGNERPWYAPEPDLSACPPGVFRLCLSHTPDNMPWARRHGIDLMLAGHNHGGQIRFPVIGSVLVPSRYSRRYDCGIFQEGPTLLHVSRGLAGQHPLRYNCRPEVIKIVLRAAQGRGREGFGTS